jgi:hypothetical protein
MLTGVNVAEHFFTLFLFVDFVVKLKPGNVIRRLT